MGWCNPRSKINLQWNTNKPCDGNTEGYKFFCKWGIIIFCNFHSWKQRLGIAFAMGGQEQSDDIT